MDWDFRAWHKREKTNEGEITDLKESGLHWQEEAKRVARSW
jgi:hypothetical protein